MAKILGMVFNRWTLLALLLAVVLAVVWLIGPLVAVADWRPLDSTMARWITTGVLLLTVVLAVGWRSWRGRRGNQQVVAQLAAAPTGPASAADSADLATVRQRFEEAMQTLRKARFSPAGSAPAAGPQAPQGMWARLTRRLSGRYLYELPWYLFVGAPGSGKDRKSVV